ncbi:MAG: hypothetical protein KGI97_08510 [Alphaproteobacteria bacterium]|nr:hypothetical protein [Alphaproteobacteria bacterium]
MSDFDPIPSDGTVSSGTNIASAPAPTPPPNWQEQDATLRDLWLKNKTPQEISDILGRSVAAIMTRAARLGLPRRAAPGRKPGRRAAIQGNGSGNGQASPRAARARDTAETAAPQPSQRICLMCLRSFASQGRHNRICPSCKGSSEYSSAVSMADIHFPV